MASSLHVWLRTDLRAMTFEEKDFAPVRSTYPGLDLVFHRRWQDFTAGVEQAEWIDTWACPPEFYSRAPRLRAVFTPAAGHDWVAADPTGRVPVHRGTFHGPLIAESMLGLMSHFNRRIPRMMANQRHRAWDRDIQFPGSMLRNQNALIVGYGSIGRHCARLLRGVGMSVVGFQRTHAAGVDADTGASYCGPAGLLEALGQAHHVVLLLPGGEETRGFFSRDHLAAMREGSFLYNFGRGTTVVEEDILWGLDEGPLAAAGLDVTESEPLKAGARLWAHPHVFLQPHSSCVYDEYRPLHIEELVSQLHPYLT